MNNEQFRRLLLKDGATKDAAASSAPSSAAALGARNIRATPRPGKANYVYDEFQRQLAEQKAKEKKERTFKSKTPAVKLAEGYIDRAKLRQDEEGDKKDEKAQRIKRLEEQLKAKAIDRKTFDTMVQQIAGGDLSTTHLVKGLDYALLEKARRGLPLSKTAAVEEEAEPTDVPDEDFDELAAQEVATVAREKTEKKGQKAMLPPPAPAPVAGQKRSRNDILAELKAQRKAAAQAAEEEQKQKYALPAGFRIVGEKGETSKVEIDSKGREVLVITDADGKTKRKVKKQRKNEEEPVPMTAIKLLDDHKTFMLKEAPPPQPEEESEDEDIFAGVGSYTNPLADLEESDNEEEPTDKAEKAAEPSKSVAAESEDEGEIDGSSDKAGSSEATSSKAPASQARRNWFNDEPLTTEKKSASSADAVVKAALRKARELDPNSSLLKTEESEKEARLRKRAAELANDRDLQDMDMGFGGSRFDDAQEMENEGQSVKLSKWRGLEGQGDDDDEDGEGGKGGKGGEKRKRGGKKRKGDKNSAVDILNAIERQKKTKTG